MAGAPQEWEPRAPITLNPTPGAPRGVELVLAGRTDPPKQDELPRVESPGGQHRVGLSPLPSGLS